MTQPLVVLLVVTRALALGACAWTVTHGVARVPFSKLATSATPRCTCLALGVRVLNRGSRCSAVGGFHGGWVRSSDLQRVHAPDTQWCNREHTNMLGLKPAAGTFELPCADDETAIAPQAQGPTPRFRGGAGDCSVSSATRVSASRSFTDFPSATLRLSTVALSAMAVVSSNDSINLLDAASLS